MSNYPGKVSERRTYIMAKNCANYIYPQRSSRLGCSKHLLLILSQKKKETIPANSSITVFFICNPSHRHSKGIARNYSPRTFFCARPRKTDHLPPPSFLSFPFLLSRFTYRASAQNHRNDESLGLFSERKAAARIMQSHSYISQFSLYRASARACTSHARASENDVEQRFLDLALFVAREIFESWKKGERDRVLKRFLKCT